RLFAPGGPYDLALRGQLAPGAPLFRDGLLQPVRQGADRASSLAGGYSAAPAVVQFILGLPVEDPVTSTFVETVVWDEDDRVLLAPELSAQVSPLARLCRGVCGRPAPVIVFEGHEGTGRRPAAAAVCREAGLSLLAIDLEALRVAAALPP